MKETPTRRYNSFLIRPAGRDGRHGTLVGIDHSQSGTAVVTDSLHAAIDWIQGQTQTAVPPLQDPHRGSRVHNNRTTKAIDTHAQELSADRSRPP